MTVEKFEKLAKKLGLVKAQELSAKLAKAGTHLTSGQEKRLQMIKSQKEKISREN